MAIGTSFDPEIGRRLEGNVLEIDAKMQPIMQLISRQLLSEMRLMIEGMHTIFRGIIFDIF